MDNSMNRKILCIDLKSFFASVECVERGLDPFKTPLVVANPEQKGGAITLAVTPFLKAQGVKSRGRIYEIPKNIKYMIAKPRMNLYIQKSKEVISIYLDFISEEDLHIYSIDECFLDVTEYLKLYKMSDYELAVKILDTIFEKTGLTATCGIGPNMLLSKIAMDIEAKHNKDCIAKWEYSDVERKLWKIEPLSEMWGIGKRMEKNLNKLGIFSVKDLAQYNVNDLKNRFGIIGEELWNHANGIDLSIISDYKKIAKTESYSHSQVLFKDYNDNNIKIIISEMIDVIVLRLKKNKKLAKEVGLGIGYSKEYNGGFYHSINLSMPTSSKEEILKTCMLIFDKYYNFTPIRKVTISCGNLQNSGIVQLDIFKKENNKEEINETVLTIKEKFGNNSIIKGYNLLKDSTAIERNKKIGGHSS